MGDQGKRPFWMPTGGFGAMLFWVALCLFLGGSAIYYFALAKEKDDQAQVLQNQEALLFQENQQLRSQVDKLQSDLAEKGSILLNREQILQQTTESLRQAQKEKEEKERLAALPPPDPNKPRHDLFNKLNESMKTQQTLSSCALLDLDQGVVLRINNTLLYSPGELEVNPSGEEILKAVGSLLKTAPIAPEIQLQSHTDNTPPAATLVANFPTNWDLSARRASSVLRVLVDKGGIPAQNLQAIGMGDTHPIAANDTKENRILNRRLEIVLHPLAN